VPAAIHVWPEALAGGPLAKVQDGDLVRLDAEAGTLQVLVPQAVWEARPPAQAPALAEDAALGWGRERRNAAAGADGRGGACTWVPRPPG
jgi:phosphogluconate dehydratase